MIAEYSNAPASTAADIPIPARARIGKKRIRNINGCMDAVKEDAALNRLTALGLAYELYGNKKMIACLPDTWDSADMVWAALTEWGCVSNYRYSRFYDNTRISSASNASWIYFTQPKPGCLRGLQPDLLYIECAIPEADKRSVDVLRCLGTEVVYA